MPDRRHSEEPQLLHALYFNRNGILFLVMALVSVGMLALSAKVHGTASQFWLAVGAATIATTCYSFLQVMLTTSQFNSFLTSAIKTNIEKGMDASRSTQAAYLPVATYPALNEMNPKFNRELNEAISSSGRYVFRGMSARHAVARLSLLPRPPHDISLIVADPAKPDAMNSRARHDAVDTSNEAFLKARQDIIDGIYMSVVGAYLTRRTYDRIKFGFTSIPDVDRVELCDTAVFIEQFSEDGADKATFPSTLRFGKESVMYQMLNQDCNSVLASPYVNLLELSGDLSEEDFLAKLNGQGMTLSAEKWDDMKRRFYEFQQQVRDKLVP
jgi:hypothetical protein